MAADFEEIRAQILAFRDAREWHQFHDPKNLAEAISIEASELMQFFLWAASGEAHAVAKKHAQGIEEEAADIFIFLTYLCNEMGFDLLDAARRKLAVNEAKYPVDKARGRSDKYRELG